MLLVGVAAAAPSEPEGVEGLPEKVEGMEELQAVEEEQEEEGGRYKRITATDRDGKSKSLISPVGFLGEACP